MFNLLKMLCGSRKEYIAIEGIKTLRNYRFLKALSTGRKYGIRELESIVGCVHTPDEKRKLLRLGWAVKRIIVPMRDRDNKLCRPSFYYLEPDEQDRARIACSLFEDINRIEL